MSTDPKLNPEHKPPTQPINVEGIPEELRAIEQWIRWKWLWKGGKWTKPPLHAIYGQICDATDQKNWGSFHDVFSRINQHDADGIGFVFTPYDPYCGTDIDDCRDPQTGELSADALEVLNALDTYSEISVSGTGAHAITRAVRGEGKKVGPWECYDRKRYFATTGQVILDKRLIHDRQDRIDAFVESKLTTASHQPVQPYVAAASRFRTLRDDEATKIYERARKYIQKLDGAIDGSFGGTATFVAAEHLVRGFDLPEEEAFEILWNDFNPRCVGPWDEPDLRRKVREAMEKSRQPVGYHLKNDRAYGRNSVGSSANGGPPLEDVAQDAAAAEMPINEQNGVSSDVPEFQPPSVTPASLGFLTLPEAVALNVPRFPRSLGIGALDTLLDGGLGAGEALVIGGAPGSYKTTMLGIAAAALSGPDTAILIIAHDEFFPRVARKIGTRFGERYSELTSDYPPVIERLRDRIAEKDAFFVMDDSRLDRPLDVIIEQFAKIVPPERHVYVLLDHIHAVELSTFTDKDSETQRIEKIAFFLATLSRRNWATIALSEITKASLNSETIRSTPLAAFAGSRKIASRADAAVISVEDEKSGDFHLIAAKTRFGPKGFGIVKLDPLTWTLATIDPKTAEANSTARAAEKASERDSADDILVLEEIRKGDAAGRKVSRELLKSSVRIAHSRIRAAIDRLLFHEEAFEMPALAPPGRTGRKGFVLTLQGPVTSPNSITS